jgi:hypothetical protein
MKNVGVSIPGTANFSRYGALQSVRNATKNILPHFPECRTVQNNPGIILSRLSKELKSFS